MSLRSDRPSVRSRALLAVGVASLAVVAMAARTPASQEPTPPQPPAPVATPAAAPGDTNLVIDTAVVVMPAPVAQAAPAGPAAWPVDPATGQTLINGVPVVGRVFVQQKVDGLVKIKDVATALAPEALPPEAPIVKSARTAVAPTAVRRQRNPMVQATLWDLDAKRSAVANRHFRPVTTGASLGQR